VRARVVVPDLRVRVVSGGSAVVVAVRVVVDIRVIKTMRVRVLILVWFFILVSPFKQFDIIMK
jgi:hypothetical protein